MIGILVTLVIGFVLGVFFGDKFLVQILRLRDWVKSKFNLLFLIALALLLPLSYGGCITLQGTRVNVLSTEINYSGSPDQNPPVLRMKSWFGGTKEIIPVDVEKKRLETIEKVGGGKK